MLPLLRTMFVLCSFTMFVLCFWFCFVLPFWGFACCGVTFSRELCSLFVRVCSCAFCVPFCWVTVFRLELFLILLRSFLLRRCMPFSRVLSLWSFARLFFCRVASLLELCSRLHGFSPVIFPTPLPFTFSSCHI